MKTPFKYGIISEAKPGYAKVYFEEDDIVTDWWPVLRRTSLEDKESWPLNVQEHVICLCDESLEDGVVLGAIHNEEDTPDPGAGAGKFRQVFEDGSSVEYDKATHKLTVDIQGDIIATATGDVEVTAGAKASVTASEVEATASSSAKVQAPAITLQGNVTVTGSLTAGSVATTGGGAITASGSVTIAGSVTAVGALSAASISAGGGSMSGGVLSMPGDVQANGKSLTGHTHTAPSGGGTTSPPL